MRISGSSGAVAVALAFTTACSGGAEGASAGPDAPRYVPVAACQDDDCAPAAPLGAISTTDDVYEYFWDGAQILRSPKAGSGSVEVLAEGIVGPGQIVAYGEAIVWTEAEGRGRLYACPKTGCDGVPRILAAGLRAPRDLAVDDHYVYFTESPPAGVRASDARPGASVAARCSVTGCAEPDVLVDAAWSK